MSDRGTQVRVKTRTVKVLNALVGKMQLESGKTATVDDAVWWVLTQTVPDLTERFKDEHEGDGSDLNGAKHNRKKNADGGISLR
jgi:hypothetical protein